MALEMRTLVAALVGLFTCGQPPFESLDGAWQSNRDITLAEFRQARSFTPEQWRLLSSPEFFGHMVYVFHGGSLVTVYEGECSAPLPYEADAASKQIHLPGSDGPVTVTLDGDRLHVPVSLLPGRLRETFTRVDLAAVVRRHPCLREVVAQP